MKEVINNYAELSYITESIESFKVHGQIYKII